MKPKIPSKTLLKALKPSPISEIMDFADPREAVKYGISPDAMISFAGGWANHLAPTGLQNAYIDLASNINTFHASGNYSHPLGLNAFKNTVIALEKYLYGIEGIKEKNIAIGSSSTQLLGSIFNVLLDDHSKVLMLDPTYSNYEAQIAAVSENIEIHKLGVIDNLDWSYKSDEAINIYENILKIRPNLLLLVTPDNPTSNVLSDSFLVDALKGMVEVGGFLVIDFAYKELFFGDKLPDYFSWPINDNVIYVRSNSKWMHSLGRRLGWVEGPEEVIKLLEMEHNESVLSPDTFHQMALSKYLNAAIANGDLKDYINQVSKNYHIASQITISAIRNYFNYPVLTPQGGLFVCMQTPLDGKLFVQQTLQKSGVLFVPGWGFGNTMVNAVRVSYGPLVDRLDLIDAGIKKAASVWSDK